MTSFLRSAGRTVPVLALASVVAAVATGCGPDRTGGGTPTSSATATATPTPGTASAAPTDTGTTTPITPGTPTPGTVTPTGSGVTGTGTSGAGPCATRDLRATVGARQGTAGSTYVTLDFENVSGRTCTLYGYPGVSQAGGSPVSQIGLSATESDPGGRRLVTLAPGATGNALLRIVDAGVFPASACAPAGATYLRVFPPNQTTPIYLAFNSQACSGSSRLLTVGVVHPGAGSAS